MSAILGNAGLESAPIVVAVLETAVTTAALALTSEVLIRRNNPQTSMTP